MNLCRPESCSCCGGCGWLVGKDGYLPTSFNICLEIQSRPERRMLKAKYIPSVSAMKNPAANIVPTQFSHAGGWYTESKLASPTIKAAARIPNTIRLAMRSSLLINGSKLSGRIPNSNPLRSIAPISRRNCCGASARVTGSQSALQRWMSIG